LPRFSCGETRERFDSSRYLQHGRRLAAEADAVAARVLQAGGANKLDFESLARVMILDRDTESGTRGRHGARKENSSSENRNPLNQAILPAEVVKRGAGE
jgi:hypothetical protein